MPTPFLPAEAITGLVLAGGRGSRMGGVDKGLQTFNGVPLALHALMRLAPQVGTTAINANRHLAEYERFGAPVWTDGDGSAEGAAAGLEAFAGPLAGFLAGLQRCTTPFLLTVPCDTPLFPDDLVARMASALVGEKTDLAMAYAPEDDGRLRPQPVFCLMGTGLLDSLREFTQAGGRRVGAWTSRHTVSTVAFDLPEDRPDAFFNANTLAELHQLAARLP